MSSISTFFQKTLFIILLIGNICVVQAHESLVQENSSWEKITDTVTLSRDFLLDVFSPASFMGSNSVSVDVDAEVREILTSIKFPYADTIRLRQLSCAGMCIFGDKNALAFGIIGLPKYIFIAEEWYKTLTYDQKRFLLAHEAAHITKHHVEFKFGFGMVLRSLYNNALNKIHPALPANQRTANILNEIIAFGMILYPTILFSRMTEMHADYEGLQAVQSADGAIAMMNTWKSDREHFDSELPQWKILKWLRTITYKYFTTHPTWENRIAYLQEWDKTQSK